MSRASERWRRVDPHGTHACLAGVPIGVRKIRWEIERVACLEEVDAAADRQLQLALDDEADFLTPVLERPARMAAGLDHHQKAFQ